MNIYETDAIKRLRSFLPECTVLLRSDGSFPHAEHCAIGAYGSGVRHTIKGGTGSGEVNSRYYVTIEEGLEKAGFSIINKDWLDGYDEILVREDLPMADRFCVVRLVNRNGKLLINADETLSRTIEGDSGEIGSALEKLTE